MTHEVVPLEMLPGVFLRYLEEDEERQKKYLELTGDFDVSPVQALLSIVDPGCIAQERYTRESLQRKDHWKKVIDGVYSQATRECGDDDPLTLSFECNKAGCSGKWTDSQPRYLANSKTCVIRGDNPCPLCKARHGAILVKNGLTSIHEETIKGRIRWILKKTGFMGTVSEDIVRITYQVIKEPWDKHFIHKQAQAQGIVGATLKDDLKRGPQGQDPIQVHTICNRCMQTTFMDKAPQFYTKTGEHIAVHRACMVQDECQKATKNSRGNVFIPTGMDDGLLWSTTRKLDYEVTKINKAVKARLDGDLEGKKAWVSLQDVRAVCVSKDGVTSKVTVCERCKVTERVDKNPLYWHDISGEHYLAIVRRICKCTGAKKDSVFIPKPIPGAPEEAYISIELLKSRLTNMGFQGAKSYRK